MMIGGYDRISIGLSDSISGAYRAPAPGECRSIEMSDQRDVSHHTSVSTIAVTEWMDRDDAIVKPYGELLW